MSRKINSSLAVENTYDTNQTDKASHKEIASPFPWCPVNREYSWKKNQIEKRPIVLYNMGHSISIQQMT